jgi:hypothetical protein
MLKRPTKPFEMKVKSFIIAHYSFLITHYAVCNFPPMGEVKTLNLENLQKSLGFLRVTKLSENPQNPFA